MTTMTDDYQDAPDFFDGLFQEQAPAQRHSATSVEAAKKIEPDANTLRGFVLAYIRGTKDRGATDEEIQDALDMNPSTQRPRRVELVRANLVFATTEKRKTKSGRSATVWQAFTF